MAENVILAETTLEASFPNDYYGGVYTSYINPSPFILTIGEKYTVEWDGETFECEAQDGSALVEGAVFIGNANLFGLSGENEPFIIGGTLDAGGTCNFLCLTDTEETVHTVAIYQIVADSEPEEPSEVGILLKDINGNEVVYPNDEKVMFDTADGGTQIFSKGEAVEGVEIALDFSGGDMTINAPEGALVKSAIIPKPADLIGANIVKGASIAGVDGERTIFSLEERTIDGDNDLTFAAGDFVVEPTSEDNAISKVTITKPSALVPENIKLGVSIAGVEGQLIGDGEEVTVALDMADGDMVIEPSEGKMLSAVTVQKPETLIPENIAEGVDIAGIIGTLAASNGGGSAVILGGTVSGVANGVTITHNLGVVPQIIVCYTNRISSGYCFLYLYVDSDVADSIGLTISSLCASRTSSGASVVAGNLSIYKYFSSITDTSFVVGSSNTKMYAGQTYNWFAVGGLT